MAIKREDHWNVTKPVEEDEDEDDDRLELPPKRGPRTAADIQRARLAKLMKNPDKPVSIPEPKPQKDPNKAPEFVYNVMGSSAGAGSGEFHVYRQIRRKEALRMGVHQANKEKAELNEAYHHKLEENERLARERTDKKRKKRQKKKELAKKKRKMKNKKEDEEESGSASDSDASGDDGDAGDKAKEEDNVKEKETDKGETEEEAKT